MKNISFLIFLYIISISSQLMAEPLYIQITGGRNVGIPIAVANFAGNNPDTENFTNVIRNDLNISGQFRSMPINRMEVHPKDPSLVDISYWREEGVEHVITGQVQYNNKGLYDVYFQIIDLYRTNVIPSLNMRFTDKHPKQFRALAHYISDCIFARIIGIKGIFSTKIAYITVDTYAGKTRYTLTVADPDGHNDKALIVTKYPLMSPAWSPDGKRIAFVSFSNNRSSIKVVDVATGRVRHISEFAGINGAPRWSPDGESLALVLSKDGFPKIYILDLKTKNIRRITHGSAIDTEPFWDNARSIIFTSNRGGKPQIYRVDLYTEKVDRLTFEGDYNATPSLTPDGKQLVMLHRNKGNFNIAVQSLQTGKVNVLTKSALDESPTIAPNGMMVLYGTKDGDRSVLGAVSLDGRFKMLLPLKNGNIQSPAWSPYLS